MIEILLWSSALVLSLAVLVKGADVFIGAAEAIGLALGLSPFVVGITIVAIGTSLPELTAGIAAVLIGRSEIAVGTAVGSNITNILLILGVAALVGRGLRVAHELIRVDLPFLFGSALLLALVAFDGEIGRLEAVLSLAALAVYLIYGVTDPDEPATTMAAAASELPVGSAAIGWKTWSKLALSGVAIHFGAEYTVKTVTELSALVGIPGAVIATSVVAFGTSLPELVVTLRSARSGKPELAVGNVIGSNVFNALGVVGSAALVGRLTVPPSTLGYSLPCMIAATVLCFFVLQEREMTRWDGWLLLLLFAGFNMQLYTLG